MYKQNSVNTFSKNPKIPSVKDSSRAKPVNQKVSRNEKVSYDNKCKNILDKCKIVNLNETVKKVKALSIDSEKLCVLVTQISEKAANDPNNAEMYAKLCYQLSTIQVPTSGVKTLSFKKVLQHQCKKEFDNCLLCVDNEQWVEKMNAIGFWNPISRPPPVLKSTSGCKRYGIIMFLGQLYKYEMVSIKSMEGVIEKMITVLDKEVWGCLCSLLFLIGKTMESRNHDTAPYLMKMKDFAKNNHFPGNSKEQLKKLILCRKNEWKISGRLDSKEKYTKKDYVAELVYEDLTQDDAWAVETLTQVVLPRRVLKNQLSQAKDTFNEQASPHLFVNTKEEVDEDESESQTIELNPEEIKPYQCEPVREDYAQSEFQNEDSVPDGIPRLTTCEANTDEEYTIPHTPLLGFKWTASYRAGMDKNVYHDKKILRRYGSERDEFKIFGEHIGTRLSKIKSHVIRMTLQHRINNILYEGEMQDCGILQGLTDIPSVRYSQSHSSSAFPSTTTLFP